MLTFAYPSPAANSGAPSSAGSNGLRNGSPIGSPDACAPAVPAEPPNTTAIAAINTTANDDRDDNDRIPTSIRPQLPAAPAASPLDLCLMGGSGPLQRLASL